MTVSGTNEKKDRAYIDFTINGETSNLTLSFTKLVSVQKIMVMLYNKGEIEMQRINEKYQYKTTPISNSEAIISGENYRFTVLTDRLMRLEYSHDEKFEDRATQTVVNRKFEVPEFSVTERNGSIKICTESMELTYHGGEFSKNSLSAKFAGANGGSQYVWYYCDNQCNLKGTARTLDGADGECELEDGIMSRDAMTVLDDSKSLILAEDGWVDTRDGDNIDIYLFAYREDYIGALKAFYTLTGRTPMIPRFALGNWWSRYYKYTQEEYKQLMLEFDRYGIPFSVAVIDMDWHYTDIAPKYGSGWTGFSWNKELFPNHKELLDFLHDRNMEVTLNLHPAEGIAAHEDRYTKLAEAMGVANGETVAFDIADPKFMQNYFKLLLNPMEKEGVSFWWMDWQQGNTTKVPALDPLWMLNHFHYIDMCSQNKRAMIFSRYAGAGSHRYPIGFSGDTIITWESLDFQPYFTANASNIGYGWWSHDIGGHMFGYRDDELVTRWVQLGVFSPIMRLHSVCNDFASKEPWNYNKISETVMIDFLRLRYKLIPYLYTMNYRAHKDSIPLVTPLYYTDHSDEAYTYNRNEYCFGSEMIVSPVTVKADGVTQMGCADTYIPDGIWFDFFNGRRYNGGQCYNIYRDIYTMPVLVKAGGIIPMSENVGDIGNPKNMTIQVFPCADNSFLLYEDDGVTMNYENGECVKTIFELQWSEKPKFIIHKPNGNENIAVKNRKYTIVFRKISSSDGISVIEKNNQIPFEAYTKDGNTYVCVDNINDETVIRFDGGVTVIDNDYKKDIFDILLRAQYDTDKKEKIYNLLKKSQTALEFINGINSMNIDCNLYNALVEAVSADGGFVK